MSETLRCQKKPVHAVKHIWPSRKAKSRASKEMFDAHGLNFEG
jgi:hypothetical protein